MHNFEVTMTHSVDTVFEWKSKGNHQANKCRIRIYWLTWETAIIIATDLQQNSSRQIASATQEIVRFATNFYNLAPNKTMLVEHYPVDNPAHEDTYLQVLLIKNKPIRYEIQKSKLVELIGKQI